MIIAVVDNHADVEDSIDGRRVREKCTLLNLVRKGDSVVALEASIQLQHGSLGLGIDADKHLMSMIYDL